VKYAQICKPGVPEEESLRLSGSGGHQRSERQMESPGSLATFFWPAALRWTPQSFERRQRKGKQKQVPRCARDDMQRGGNGGDRGM